MIRSIRKTIALSALVFWPLTPFVSAQNPATTTHFRENLPSFHIAQSGKPVKCGLDDIMYLRQNMAAFSIARQNELKSSLARPSLPMNFISPSGVFRIHYSTTGVHRVDTTSTNGHGAPDYVWEAALAADQSYQMLVETLGFNAHLSDNGVDGPEFDIYIVNTRSVFSVSYYGATTPEERVGNGWTSYIAVENDFEENFFTKGLDALRVTIAHEYFHAIHFSYYFRDEDVFFYEMSSTWFEDEAYPEVNDYLQYLPQLFRTLDDPLHKKDGWHEYGS
ncbi:MAG: MXAN_6640 family putative metalloprotease, partial [bacterium]